MDLEHCPVPFGRKSVVEAARKSEPESRGLVLQTYIGLLSEQCLVGGCLYTYFCGSDDIKKAQNPCLRHEFLACRNVVRRQAPQITTFSTRFKLQGAYSGSSNCDLVLTVEPLNPYLPLVSHNLSR